MSDRYVAAGPGTGVYQPAGKPGAPVYVSNRYFSIDASNNSLQFTSYKEGVILGGPVLITVAAGYYDGAGFAAAWQAAINGNTTLTGEETEFACLYDASLRKLIYRTAGEEYALELSGVGTVSTAAADCGYEFDKAAAQELVGDSEAYGLGTVTFDIDPGDNGIRVLYSLYCNELGKYIGADGVADESTDVWGLLSDWDNGGQAGRVTVPGLTEMTRYTFKARAKNEAGDIGEWSDDSAVMMSMPPLDGGDDADIVPLDVSTGNTKIVSDTRSGLTISGNRTDTRASIFYGDISMTFLLQSYRSLAENGIEVQYSEDYDPDNPELASWGPATIAAGSCAISGLTATDDGVKLTFKWDSYTDAGPSEYQKNMYLRIRAIDDAGDPGSWVIAGPFGINNRPAKIQWIRYQGVDTDYPYDKNTRPTLRAVIPDVRGGGPLFPTAKYVRKSDGEPVLTLNSFDSLTGWRYEDDEGWKDLTQDGIPAAAVDGAHQMEITVPEGRELPHAEYLITGKMYEYRNRG